MECPDGDSKRSGGQQLPLPLLPLSGLFPPVAAAGAAAGTTDWWLVLFLLSFFLRTGRRFRRGGGLELRFGIFGDPSPVMDAATDDDSDDDDDDELMPMLLEHVE